MILYQYLCLVCDTLNHIHWEITHNGNAPCCCECGEGWGVNYKFIKTLEVEEDGK